MTDSALFYNRLGFDISRKLNNAHLLAKGYGSLGGIYLYGGQKVKALDNLINAITLDSLDEELFSSTCFSLGLLYADAGRKDMSLFYYLKALDIREKNHQWIEKGYIYSNIAEFYIQTYSFREGIKIYNSALAMFRKENDMKGQAYVYNNIGMTLIGEDMLDSALLYFRKALEINSKDTNGTRSAYVFNLTNIGDTWLKYDRQDSAEIYYQQAQEIAKRSGDHIALSCIGLSMGEINTKQRKYSKAIEWPPAWTGSCSAGSLSDAV